LPLDEQGNFVAAAATRAWYYLRFDIAVLRTNIAAFDVAAK
jgi:hypothetical protein